MANLAKGGRAGVVIPEGVLFRGGPDQKVRKELLEQFNVHTILSLPAGCFLPYTGVKTNVIFFDRPKDGTGTKSVWFYELTNDGFELKQTRKPIEGNQIPDFLAKWQKRVEGENSWTVPIEEIIERGYDLSAKNPNRKDDYEHRPALELVQSIKAKEERIMDLLGELEGILEDEMDALQTGKSSAGRIVPNISMERHLSLLIGEKLVCRSFAFKTSLTPQTLSTTFDGISKIVIIVDTGDLLISWSATLGSFIWDRGPAVLNQHIFKVIPDEKIIDKEFLHYLVLNTLGRDGQAFPRTWP